MKGAGVNHRGCSLGPLSVNAVIKISTGEQGMETQDIKDFSDLGDETFFLFKGQKYAIAQPTRSDMTKMLRVNQKISAHVNRAQPKGADDAPSDGDQSVTDMDGLFALQQEFILLGVRKVQPESGQRVELTQAELEAWPMKLMHKVIRMVNDILSSGPEKEERPT
jgi:hypothetical protein